MDIINYSKVLELPKGTPGTGILPLDMTKINEAEGQLAYTRSSNIAGLGDLMSIFNMGCNVATKYISWIKYESLKAEHEFDLAKAEVLIDKLPEAAAALKERGIKDNADFRDALIARDPKCRSLRDTMIALEAAQTFIEAKAKVFERAYWECKESIKMNSTQSSLPDFGVQQSPYVNPHPPFEVSNMPQSIGTHPRTQMQTTDGTFFIGKSKF